ncbi:5319_t:CDS:2, partial [Racocetra fulgida]
PSVNDFHNLKINNMTYWEVHDKIYNLIFCYEQNEVEGDTSWSIYVVTSNYLYLYEKTEKGFINAEIPPQNLHDPLLIWKKIPQNLQKVFDDALDNELGPSFHHGYPVDIVEACVVTPYGFVVSTCQAYQENDKSGSSIGVIEPQRTSGTFSAIVYDKDSKIAFYKDGICKNFTSKIYRKDFGVDAAFYIFANNNRTLYPNKFSISPEYFKKANLPENTLGKTTGLTHGKLVPIINVISIGISNESIEFGKKQRKISSYSNITGKKSVDREGKALGILHAAWLTEHSRYAIASPYFAVFEALNIDSPNLTNAKETSN